MCRCEAGLLSARVHGIEKGLDFLDDHALFLGCQFIPMFSQRFEISPERSVETIRLTAFVVFDIRHWFPYPS